MPLTEAEPDSCNPMYFGVLFVILGWAALYHSFAVLVYTLLVWGLFHLFVLFIEEPALRRLFGEEYEAYCRRVRRWAPGRRNEFEN